MRASKATPYEESAHIPFLIRWPGVKNPGSRSAAFFGAIDFVPSLLGACGVPLPDGLQGRDISSMWRGESALDETDLAPGATDSVFLMNMGNGWPDRLAWVVRWRGVRTERYNLSPMVRLRTWPLAIRSARGSLETRNMVNAREVRPVVEEMETRLHRWMEATGDPFEYGRRGPRGFVDVGQRWADPIRWKDWGTA